MWFETNSLKLLEFSILEVRIGLLGSSVDAELKLGRRLGKLRSLASVVIHSCLVP